MPPWRCSTTSTGADGGCRSSRWRWATWRGSPRRRPSSVRPPMDHRARGARGDGPLRRRLARPAGGRRRAALRERRVADGALVGCTRFFIHDHWKGRAAPDEVEIGGTWLAPDASAPPSTPRPSSSSSPTPSTSGRASGSACAPTPETSAAAAPSSGSGHASRACCAHTDASHVAGEEGRAREAMFAITQATGPAVRRPAGPARLWRATIGVTGEPLGPGET